MNVPPIRLAKSSKIGLIMGLVLWHDGIHNKFTTLKQIYPVTFSIYKRTGLIIGCLIRGHPLYWWHFYKMVPYLLNTLQHSLLTSAITPSWLQNSLKQLLSRPIMVNNALDHAIFINMICTYGNKLLAWYLDCTRVCQYITTICLNLLSSASYLLYLKIDHEFKTNVLKPLSGFKHVLNQANIIYMYHHQNITRAISWILRNYISSII